MEVIKHASYFCYSRESNTCDDDGSSPKPQCKTNKTSFYTFDGKLIAVVSHSCPRSVMELRLDPKAARPQVYKVKHKRFFVNNNFDMEIKTNFVMFYDNNGNLIGGDVYYGSELLSAEDLHPYSNVYDLSAISYYNWTDNDDDDDHDGLIKYPTNNNVSSSPLSPTQIPTQSSTQNTNDTNNNNNSSTCCVS